MKHHSMLCVWIDEEGCSYSVLSANQLSLKYSPCISHILCRIQHAVITVGICSVLMSFLFINLLHLALRRPNAFSTTMRALDNL